MRVIFLAFSFLIAGCSFTQTQTEVVRLVNSEFVVPKSATVEKLTDPAGKKILNIFYSSGSDKWQVLIVSFISVKKNLKSNVTLTQSILTDLEKAAENSEYDFIAFKETGENSENMTTIYEKRFRNSNKIIHGKIIADKDPVCIEYFDQPNNFSTIFPQKIIKSRKVLKK